jgi:hypothetical protein
MGIAYIVVEHFMLKKTENKFGSLEI